MHARTVLAMAGSALALPSAALAATAPDNEPTGHDALRASGRLTVDAHSVRRAHAHRRRSARPAIPAPLRAIAACESGGNPTAVGGGGLYRGKYQFSTATWAAVGGKGDPAAASEAEQDRRAAILYARSGASSWPVCGR